MHDDGCLMVFKFSSSSLSGNSLRVPNSTSSLRQAKLPFWHVPHQGGKITKKKRTKDLGNSGYEQLRHIQKQPNAC